MQFAISIAVGMLSATALQVILLEILTENVSIITNTNALKLKHGKDYL